jgi:hypothetical protein
VDAARDHGTVEQKRRIIEIVDQLTDVLGVLPLRMTETRNVFVKQTTPNKSCEQQHG